MTVLHHLWLSAPCRQVRIVLAEKDVDVALQVENTWERRREFLALNPAGEVPVLVEADGVALSGSGPISEYLEEVRPEPALLPTDPRDRAEARRLVEWFDRKFAREVTDNLVGEKLMKRFLGLGEPDSTAIRAGHANIRTHLDYVDYLVERRRWLAGDELSLADAAAAAHLSAVDYLGKHYADLDF
jgi:glutathione S-transferase